ncbi:3-ketodihydrosphingosine reductase-like isoform X2 [Liolophura sinensis]|uniref:3-ketodihydrosphingosine reductase-like isoform X2 n=1 Tax=Liolophura sinensis TaxID=3198878 RepID=UPI003158324F
MFLIVAISLFGLFIIVLYVLSPLIAPKPFKLEGSHVMVTGGSSGIGQAIAVEAVKAGANVSLLARNQAKLTAAKADVEKYVKNKDTQKVQCISVDLSRDFSEVERTVKEAEQNLGPVQMLINCVGTSISGVFEEIPLTEFKRMLDINYMGSVHATRAVVPSMKSQQHGRIVFVSSQAGQLGLFGYTAYSASKFALRGLAEALHMELKPHNIYVSLAFPPDTDTPGFAEEQISKPEETRLISETAGLFKPDVVARSILSDALLGRFLCYIGVDGYMLTSLTCGMSPVISITEATQQVVTMGLFRIISLFYLDSFDRVVRKCKEKREQNKSKSS